MPFQEMSKIGLIYTPKTLFPKKKFPNFFFPEKTKIFPQKIRHTAIENSFQRNF
jgi:hypothetical protein